MKRTDEVYRPALQGKEIPILTLDNRWHKLFTQADSNVKITELSKELNALLMRQGKLNTETKGIRRIKKKMMDDIMEMADLLEKNPDKKLEKKLAETKRLIDECNEKMKAYQEEMIDLPKEIENVNFQLMLSTMEVCYDKLKENSDEIDEIEKWIKEIRIELKKKIIRKQEKEILNHNLYVYMHDVFGADVIDIFDMKYNPEEKHPKLKNLSLEAAEEMTDK